MSATAELKAEKKTASGDESDSPMDILLNSPESVTFKERLPDGKIISKTIEIRRCTVRTLEKSVQPLLRVISLLDDSGNLQVASLRFLMAEDMQNLRDVIVTCTSLSSDEFSDLSLPIFMQVVTKWLKINRGEVKAFLHSFLDLKVVLEGYQKDFQHFSPKKDGSNKTQTG